MVRLVGVFAAGGIEQAGDLVNGERLWQEPRLAGQVEVGRDVDPDQALPEREPVEALERGRAAAKARRGEAWLVRAPSARSCGEVVERDVRRAVPAAGDPFRRREV